MANRNRKPQRKARSYSNLITAMFRAVGLVAWTFKDDFAAYGGMDQHCS